MGSVDRERRIAEIEKGIRTLKISVAVTAIEIVLLLLAILALTSCTDAEPVGPDWKPCELVVYLTLTDSTLVQDSVVYEECRAEPHP